jgi:hypothetical protein
VNIRDGAHRVLELRSFARCKTEPETHRIRDSKDVREQDRGIELVTPQRLHRYFAGEFGVAAEAHEVASLGPRCPVFGKVTSGLAHDPDRGARYRLAQ